MQKRHEEELISSDAGIIDIERFPRPILYDMLPDKYVDSTKFSTLNIVHIYMLYFNKICLFQFNYFN